MNRMIINATHNEEWRIALANGQYLYDVIIQSTARIQTKGNIYKGKVIRIEPSLEAAFIHYGAERHGFLPLKEVAYRYYKDKLSEHNKRLSIVDILEPGQELLVQINKEECSSKGAALTTSISLAGAYVVLSPNNSRASGISRHLDEVERKRLQEIRRSLHVPEGMGLIIRTAGGSRSLEELQWDLEILLHLWEAMQSVSLNKTAPLLIYQESNVVIRALRDYLRKDIEEILVDNPTVYQEVIQHLGLMRPDFVSRVKLYQDLTPLFTRFQIENQIESAFQRKVQLPSGGSIILDSTEALSSIDVNSAKSTKGKDIEDTALMTNLEAADEIARQLRLRDIGGLIIIDFIDMMQEHNRRKVEKRLQQALLMDRAHVNIDRILPDFGLLALSRERLSSSLDESSHITCPQCLGQGTIRGIISLSLAIMRLIEEEALKENTTQIRAIVPINIAAYLLNEKRQTIIAIEQRQNISIMIIPNLYLLVPQYKIERIRRSDPQTSPDKINKVLSYQLTHEPNMTSQSHTLLPATLHSQPIQEPAIQTLAIEAIRSMQTIAPTLHKYAPKAPKLLKKLLNFLFNKKRKPVDEPSTTSSTTTVISTPPTIVSIEKTSASSQEGLSKFPPKRKYSKNYYRPYNKQRKTQRNELNHTESSKTPDGHATNSDEQTHSTVKIPCNEPPISAQTTTSIPASEQNHQLSQSQQTKNQGEGTATPRNHSSRVKRHPHYKRYRNDYKSPTTITQTQSTSSTQNEKEDNP